MPSVEITLDGSTIVVILATCVAVAAAIVFYRFTLPAVSPLTRALLSALRAAALGLLVFLVFAPALRLTSSTQRQPLLGLLIDGTGSMQLRDGGLPRFQVTDSLVRGPAVDALSAVSRLQAFSIGADLQALPSPDSVTYVAPITDLAAAIEGLAQRHRRTPFTAILVLSDGAYNRGEHPVHAAEKLGIPIVAVGIGDTT